MDLDPKSELILTIMASIAQEESRSISQNVTWGKRVGFQEGKVSFPYSSFLGYKKEDEKIVIDEDQAVIVRLIYKLFLVEGKTCSGIANYLKSQHIKTPSGKSTRWTKNTVYSILTNEKYKGDALLQKKFTDNYLEHSLVKNTGQIPQYYVENSHQQLSRRICRNKFKQSFNDGKNCCTVFLIRYLCYKTYNTRIVVAFTVKRNGIPQTSIQSSFTNAIGNFTKIRRNAKHPTLPNMTSSQSLFKLTTK